MSEHVRAVKTGRCRACSRASAITAFISILLCSCAAVFVAPYDETTDRLLTDLTVQTETTIARADAGQLSGKERQDFFDNALGTVRTLKARSSLFAKNSKEVEALAELEKRYDSLRKYVGPPRTSVTTGLRLTLLSLQQIQVAKKRSNTFTASLKSDRATP